MRVMRERKVVKKRKKAAGTVVGSGSGGTWPDDLPDEIISNILTRLPAKNLRRCMCVSKGWCSIIREPMFIRAYLRQQRLGSLLISVTDTRDFKGDLRFPDDPIGLAVYYSPLREAQDENGPEPFLSLMKIPAFEFFKGVTEVVNGLVCAYGSNGGMVCNVCTGEVVWLPEISGFCNSSYEDYYFGYHPSTRVYKLLKISKSNAKQEAHILTLGLDSSWRKLAIGLDGDERLPAASFLCNGVLYWAFYGLLEPLGLISFDLKTEKFQFISPPKDPIYSSRHLRWIPAKFRGRLALSVHGLRDRVTQSFDLHTLDDCDDRGRSSWSRYTIPYPPGIPCPYRSSILPVGNLTTDQILMSNLYAWKDSNPFVLVYSYDYQKNKFERFIVGSIPRDTIRDLGFAAISISYNSGENIVPLEVLFGRRMKAKVDASIS